ncbi:MAG: class I SAM-dependent methyltransferase [Thermoanaerobaculia bacterium]
MRTADWQLWDREGVAEAIELYWAESPAERAHRDLLAALCARYLPAPGLDVLEVGCGTGRIYERLVPRLVANERYTGVDVSERMLAIAREKFPRARFLPGDGYGLGFADGAFDVALAFEVVGHLPEIGPFLRELARVARRAAVFTVWPAAGEDDGVVESREEILGARFLHRQYSHGYLLRQIREQLPDAALDLEVGVLGAGCRAYALRRREGSPGLAFTRLFPVQVPVQA